MAELAVFHVLALRTGNPTFIAINSRVVIPLPDITQEPLSTNSSWAPKFPISAIAPKSPVVFLTQKKRTMGKFTVTNAK